MALGTVKHPWDEELQLWALIFIKKETLARIPPRYGFSQSQKLVDHRDPAWVGSTGITEYRVRKSKKRFLGLDYGEWSNLPQDLKSVHPKFEEYQKERHRQRLEAAEDAQEDIGQTAQAQHLHIGDLLSLAREWKEHLVFDVGDAILVQESKVPSSFSKGDETAGWHEMGPLVWLVEHDGQVEVWLAVERRHRLFGALMEHLPPDVADTYEAIKTEIRDALTQMMESQAARISVTGLPSRVSELAEKLDVVVDSRVLGGNCEVCRRITGEDVI
jgi:hypothetical protein